MRSTLALPNDYVVVDIETTGTNSKQDDIIEIAAIKYRDGKEVGRFSQLVATDKPLSGFIINLTGITSETLVGQPPIQEVIQEFSVFVGDDMLVGHNIASFDSCFIAEAYTKYLNRELTNPCVDTLRIHKKLYPRWHRHSLEYLAFFYGISYEGAHCSSVDCEITNACYRCMRDEILANATEAEFCDRPAKPKKKITDIVPTVNSFDPNNPLFQKTVVFTGGLAISRQDAMQLAVNVGAIPRGSVTAKTDYLVVGGEDISCVEDIYMSSKEKKALFLNAAGKAQIQIISEKEFFNFVPNLGTTE